MALALPIVVAASMAAVPSPATAAVPAALAKPVCPAERSEEAAALVTARMCGDPVVISGLTTATDEAVATPDGKVKLRHNFRPVRVRQGGDWVPVDTTLSSTADGRIAAKAASAEVSFSADGTGDLVKLTDQAGSVGLASPFGQLPTPEVDGDTATYRNVLPDVDLRLRADVEGYSQVVVVKSAKAAANPKLRRLAFKVTGKGLTMNADKSGNLKVANAQGRVVLAGNTPLMWDAAAAASRGTGAASDRVDTSAEHETTMPAAVAAGELTVTPDTQLLDGADTVFPLYIDPGFTVNRAGFSVVSSAAPDTTFWNTPDDAFVGSWDGGTSRYRSFFSYDLTGTSLGGKYVSNARLDLNEVYAATCQPAGFEVWSTDLPTAQSTWNKQPAWYSQQSASTVTKGYSPAGVGGASDCPAGNVPMDVTSYVQSAASSNWNGIAFGVRATNDTDPNAWKRFSNNPTLTVTYTAYPTAAAGETVPSTPCVTGASRPYLNTATPMLQARVNDPEGAPVRAEFAWTGTDGTAIGSTQSTQAVASGQVSSVTIPGGQLSNTGSYAWKVRGFDGTTWGPWSAPCEFTVDSTAPTAAPGVSSTTYPANTWAGATGTAGTFTFGAAGTPDIAAYVYGVDNTNPSTTVNTATLGAGASVSVTPASDGPHTITVRARDRAGNLSPMTTYAFNVGTGAVTSPATGDLSAGKVTLEGKSNTTTSGVTFQWRRGDTDTWVTIPAADVVRESGGTAVSAWPVAPTTAGSGSYPRLVWNVEKTVNAAEAGVDALDGPVQIRATFSGTSTGSSSPVRISFDRNAAGAATQEIGPGSVNLLTGNLTLSDTDVSFDAYGSDLTVTRSYNTRLATVVDSANMFGPGWTSSAIVDNADTPYTKLVRTGNLVQIGLPDGTTLGFTAKTTTTYTPEAGAENLQLTSTTTPDAYTLTDDAGTVVTFTRVTGSPVGTYHPTSVSQTGSGQTTTITWEKVTIGAVDYYRPTQMLAPVPASVTCTTLVRGCRALTITYATATTATGTTAATLGDYLGRVRQIAVTAWDPDLATPAMSTVVLARYAYDNTGRLRSTWDPRLDYTDSAGAVRHLDDAYTYNTDGILTTTTPASQPAWQLAYTTIPGDAGKGRLASMSRSALTAGTATTTVVYKIPTGTTGPNDLSPAQTARWGQQVAPVDATAIYPATQVPDGNQATGVLPSSATRATIYYLDANGRTVDTAAPDNHIDATWYDAFGNMVRSLDADNIDRALYGSDTDTPTQEAALADRLSTVNTYSPDGIQLLETLEPEHDIVLNDWSTVRGRAHTRNTYDQNAPATTNPYNLITTSTKSAHYLVNGADVDVDAHTTTTDYNWSLRQPSTQTVDPSALSLVTASTYDATTGLLTSLTTPAGKGTSTTASTRATIYYRASTGSGYSECDNRPEWANLPCRVQPGGQPATGAELPVKVTTYDMFNQPRVVTDKTSTATLRTQTTTYDKAGRVYETSTTAPGQGTAVPTTRTIYDPATGLVTRTQSIVGGAVTAQIIRAYDGLGQQTSYTDADNNASTTTYDILSRVATTSDGKATRTYTYDSGSEHRDLLTQVTDSQAGTFTAAYDGAGNAIRQNWSGGVITNSSYDETGQKYYYIVTRTSTSTSTCTTYCAVYNDWIQQDAFGTNRWDTSSLDHFGYVYDNAGRLTDAEHTVSGNCSSHHYSYDAATNRTGMTTSNPTAGACNTDTTNQRTWTYDSANRTTNTGYNYDALGRTLTAPSADTPNTAGNLSITYHATDLVDTITQNGRTTDYTLDVTGERIRSYTDSATGTAAHINHYDGDSDNPAWTQENATAYTRPFDGVDGLAGIYNSATGTTTYQITNLHGDIAATFQTGSPGLTTTNTTDEFGNSTTAGATRYGWLGSEQRAADTPGGVTLMGVRLYNSGTGRFLQVDPVYGGNCNAYDYVCGDPVNGRDLSGKCFWDLCVGEGIATYAIIAFIGGAIIYYAHKAAPSIRRAVSAGGHWVADKARHIWHSHKKKKPLNQENRKGHRTGASKSKNDKHTNGDAHGGRRNIPPNPNKNPDRGRGKSRDN